MPTVRYYPVSDFERTTRDENTNAIKELGIALFNHYKRELTLLFIACDVLLGLTLLTDFQTLVLKDTAKANATVAPITDQQAATTSTPSATTAGSTVAWPLHGHVTAEFGDRTPYQSSHSGIDVSSYQPAGNTSISPVRQGTVTEAGQHGGLGNRIVIDHGEGITATYAHLDSIAVSPGQIVNPGESLGREGSTGNSTGPHLHLEVRKDGQLINPREFLP